MRQLFCPMRAHGAAAVLVRINQRTEGRGALKPGVHGDPHFAQHLKIRPEPRADDQFVGGEVLLVAADRAGDGERVASPRDRPDAIGTEHRQAA